MAPQTISVIGGLDADLIMIANRIPNAGESVLANEYHEALGGKGANSAIAAYRTCHKKSMGMKQTTDDDGGAVWTTDEQPPPTFSEPATTADEYEDNIQVKMIGALGHDQYRDRFMVELEKNGIDTFGVVTDADLRTSICFVMVEHSTGESRCLFTLGASATWTKEDFMETEQLGNGMRPDLVIAQMEIDKEVVETMIETAGKAGVDFCLNAAPATPIAKRIYRHLTHLLVNESEAAIMSGRARDEVNEETWPVIAQEFLNCGVKNVVITLGAKGAFYATATETGHCPAYKVKVVDTTGAGDTFTGAYASDYLRQKAKGAWDIKHAVVRANKAAAITIQSLGAQNGIPWGDEIDRFDT